MSAVEALEEEVVATAVGQSAIRLSHHSYRVGLWEAAVFAKQQWAEATARVWKRRSRL